MKTLPVSLKPVNDKLAAALLVMRNRALERYPDEQPRIDRGHTIAWHGGVELHADGTASVLSQSLANTWYTVNGACICYDAGVAPGGRCKHRWAKAMIARAMTALAEHTDAPLEYTPAPYTFPVWTVYEATYVGHGQQMQGVAKKIDNDCFYFVPDGMTTGFYCDYAAVALGPGLAEERKPA